ncbi:MAG: TIGR02300 family protein [Hyphomicrobiaceae bacterium]|nr:TIGR02300 family protein [Hyphomicrobiaceae bacterium]
MATKAARGTKRTCQNPECGARFYDLSRDPIVCPICQSVYRLATAPQAVVPAEDKAVRRPKKPEPIVEEQAAAGDVPLVEGEEALADLEGGDEAIVAEDEEPFIEPEEEDGGDVSGILGTVGEVEEER